MCISNQCTGVDLGGGGAPPWATGQLFVLSIINDSCLKLMGSVVCSTSHKWRQGIGCIGLIILAACTPSPRLYPNLPCQACSQWGWWMTPPDGWKSTFYALSITFCSKSKLSMQENALLRPMIAKFPHGSIPLNSPSGWAPLVPWCSHNDVS